MAGRVGFIGPPMAPVHMCNSVAKDAPWAMPIGRGPGAIVAIILVGWVEKCQTARTVSIVALSEKKKRRLRRRKHFLKY